MLTLAPDLILKTDPERFLERSLRETIATARQLDPERSGRLEISVTLRSDVAEDLGVHVPASRRGLTVDLSCTVDVPPREIV